MRVLYLNHTSQISGAEHALLALLRHLPDGIQPALACPKGPLADAAAELGVPTFPVSGTDVSLKLHPFYTPRALARMAATSIGVRRLARRFGADLVHANSIRAGVIAVASAQLGGPPVVVHLQDRLTRRFPSSAALRVISRGAQGILACSEYVLAPLPQGSTSQIVRVVHNPVDPRHFDPSLVDRDAARERLGLGTEELALVMVAQITPWKGQDDALRMLDRLRDRQPSARLLLVGSPKFVGRATRYDNLAFARSLDRLTGELGLDGRVDRLGERPDIPELLRAADIFLVPSWEEPFSLAALEAMAMELPVVATSEGGMGEIIDGTNGLVLPPRQPELWAGIVDELASDPRRRADIGARARKTVQERVDVVGWSRSVIDVYGAVLGGARADTGRRHPTDSSLPAPELSSDTPGAQLPAVLMLGKGWFPEQLGGLDRYFRDLLEHLPEARGLVVGPAPGNPERLTTASRHDAPLPSRLLALWRAARTEGLDAHVVDAHFALYALAPMLFGRLRSLPAIVHFQGPWADENIAAGDGSRVRRALRRALERLVYRRAERIVVLTSAFRRVIVENYRVSPWRVRVAPPGVDLNSFTPGDRRSARERFGLEAEVFVAVAVRRLVPRMGLDVLIEAWSRALPELPDGARLLIAGEGPEREPLNDQANRLGLSVSMHLLGSLSDEALVDLYRAADVGIVPTRSFEGFGLVVIEAAACGTPTIVTQVGGLPEAVCGLDPSLAVRPSDARALAHRIVRACAPSGLPSRERTRRFAEGFSWTVAVERNRAILREALSPEPARRRVRVVYLDHVAKLSGGEIALLRLLPHLTDVEPHVILAEDGPFADRLVQAGISTEVLHMRRSARDLRKRSVTARALPPAAVAHTAVYIVRLAIHLRRLRPDVVHTNSLKAGLYGSLAARLAGIPVVWHLRDRIADDYLPPPAVRLIRGMTHRFAAVVLANSEATVATIGGLNSAIIYSVLPDVLPPAAAPASRDGRACTFGMVGRIAAWKGQDLFLRAFARAFPTGAEGAVIIGAPMFDEQNVEDELRALVRDLRIDERVEFRGFREDVWRELQDLDVLVHASTTPEPFGQVVVEGMAAGLPVIAPNEGGPAEILSDGVTGRLFSARDVVSLADVLVELRDSPEERVRLGAAAREAVEPFKGENVAATVHRVYEDILGRALPVIDGGMEA